MGYWRRSANLRWRKREARGPLGEIFILNIYPYKKDRNATQCDECENRMAAKKGQGLVRTALNQGYRTLLVLNVPKRLAWNGPVTAFLGDFGHNFQIAGKPNRTCALSAVAQEKVSCGREHTRSGLRWGVKKLARHWVADGVGGTQLRRRGRVARFRGGSVARRRRAAG